MGRDRGTAAAQLSSAYRCRLRPFRHNLEVGAELGAVSQDEGADRRRQLEPATTEGAETSSTKLRSRRHVAGELGVFLDLSAPQHAGRPS